MSKEMSNIDLAKDYIEKNLFDCATEVLIESKSGILSDGKLREAIRMMVPLTGELMAARIARELLNELALQFVCKTLKKIPYVYKDGSLI